jgi:competence protein ComEC
MQPSVALIGVGVNNDYGHPHEETLADLEAAGAEVYRTDLDGNILVVSDGRSIDVQVGQ